MPLTVDPSSPIVPGPDCPINCTIGAIGSRAAILLLRQAFYGDRRFDAFVEHTGISEATVAKRLQELVEVGALARVPYQDAGSRVRQEYELTQAGEELFPVLVGLFLWGQKHLDRAGTALELIGPEGDALCVGVHAGDGKVIESHDVHLAVLRDV